jgi:ketosteroid isomerase-like protein
MSGNVHVLPGDHGWDVRIEGGSRTAHFQTQDEAIRAGRTLARDNRSEHIIHGRDGRIRQRDSYGHDPFRP